MVVFYINKNSICLGLLFKRLDNISAPVASLIEIYIEDKIIKSKNNQSDTKVMGLFLQQKRILFYVNPSQ